MNEILTLGDKLVIDALTKEIRNISTGGEIHGAVISVVNEDGGFVGCTCELWYDGIIIKSKTISDEGIAYFSEILNVGDYTIKIEHDGNIYEIVATITYEDIVLKNVIEKIMNYRTYIYNYGVENISLQMVGGGLGAPGILNNSNSIMGCTLQKNTDHIYFTCYRTGYNKGLSSVVTSSMIDVTNFKRLRIISDLKTGEIRFGLTTNLSNIGSNSAGSSPDIRPSSYGDESTSAEYERLNLERDISKVNQSCYIVLTSQHGYGTDNTHTYQKIYQAWLE